MIDVVCQGFTCTPDKAVELLSSPRWRRLTIACLESRLAERLVSDFRESNGTAEGSFERTMGKWTAADAAFFTELKRAAGYEQVGMHELS